MSHRSRARIAVPRIDNGIDLHKISTISPRHGERNTRANEINQAVWSPRSVVLCDFNCADLRGFPVPGGRRAHGGGQKGAVGRQQKAEGQGGSPPSTVWTRVRGEKTCTFRINIVPRSHKEKGRSSRVVWRGAGAEDRTRIRGRTSSLSSVVAVVDFTASEGRLFSPLERSSPACPFSCTFSPPCPCPPPPPPPSPPSPGPSVVHCLVNAGTLTQLTQRSAITLIRRSRDAL